VKALRWRQVVPAAAKQLQKSLAHELEEVDVEGTHLWHLRAARYPRCEADVHLVPQFDSYVVGCHPREQLIPPVAAERLGRRDTAAPFAVLLVDGVVGGLWSRQRTSKRLAIRVDPFSTLSTAQREQLHQQAARIGEFLGVAAELSFAPVELRGHL
jgi:hypothetical protein